MWMACVGSREPDSDQSRGAHGKATTTAAAAVATEVRSTPGASPARAPVDGPSIAFKSGRLGLSEKKLGLERHPSVVAAVFGFHQLVAQRRQEDGEGGLPLLCIPREHWPLVAMLVQERDAAMPSLVKSIESQLCPVLFGEEGACNADILAAGVVESTIAQLAECRNYGVPLDELQRASQGYIDVPQGLSINRWEVTDVQLLPSDVRSVVLKRRGQREAAQVECAQWFRALDAQTREQILAGTLKRLKGKVQSAAARGRPSEADAAADGPAGGVSGDAAPGGAPCEASPRKARHALRGQRSLQNFFATERQPLHAARPNDLRGYYESTFLPFNLRNNTEMYMYRRPAGFDAGCIDHVLSATSEMAGGAGDLPRTSELLRELAESSTTAAVDASAKPGRVPAVADGIDLDEVELHLLRLRTLRMKLVQFHGTRRPGYFGTWSRSLQRVCGRRPFAQDTAELDYAVDSDAEWEAEDEEGEDLRSEDDEDDDDEEDDEDFDDECGFVVGDGVALARTHERLSRGMDGLDDGLETDGSGFCSDDEELEEIDPDEEVCADSMEEDVHTSANDMDVDGEVGGGRPAGASMAPLASGSSAPGGHQPTPRRPKHRDADEHRPQRRRRVVPLTPVVVGLAPEDNDDGPQASRMDVCGGDGRPQQDGKGGSVARAHLLALLAVVTIDAELPLAISVEPADMWENKRSPDSTSGLALDDSSEGVRRGKAITDEDLCVLANVVHGSSLGVSRLVEELKRQMLGATKAQIERLIHEHARKEKRAPTTRLLWYVNTELVEKAQALKLAAGAASASAADDPGPAPDTGDPAALSPPGAGAKRQRTSAMECGST
ncbi:hypothetical protein LPJ61_000614 [Coemansia biformis]|uniref:Chromatin assembly factor 1 subunit A dimerization domain-containing protein n=1 Tax=Coemansia biformis TaxID=1286918 RepID=A0A9W7YII9_9FUNG|nr:hypothetical protein LPJ61_000614 [Coemansia biformis]